MVNGKISEADRPKINRVEVYWHTVTYRTILLYALIIVILIAAAGYLVVPDTFTGLMQHLSKALTPKESSVASSGFRGARFVNLDGKVQVKKVNSVQWTSADYQLTLDKGDLIQTGADGVARIAFADGTTYTVQADTLVTVEENLVPQDRASSVGVHISAGAVDLTTGSWQIPGSKAEVSFQDAVASLKQNSRADVRTNPTTQANEITVAAGSAVVQRGSEQTQVGQWQRAEFTAAGPITKTDVLAPPGLVQPVNLQPIIVPDPKHAPIHFEWQPVATAQAYELEISDTAMFTKLVADRKTDATNADITGIDAGDYFWTVKAIDAKNQTSEIAPPYKFTLVEQSKEQSMLLEVDGTEIHGKVVEIFGRTEPGSALIINGESVADMSTDGHFRYFTAPLATGDHVFVITGQNRRGGTAIKRVPVVVP
jgi:hypothetical protein